MEHRITVPEELGDKNLNDFFIGWNWFDQSDEELVFDFSRSKFLSPWAITLFATHALAAKNAGCQVRPWVDETTKTGRYLLRAGLFPLLGLHDERVTPKPSDRMTQLTNIRESEHIPPFVKSVMQILKIEDEEIEGAVEYSLVELLRNVVQHSRSPVGGVALAHYFPTTGLVEVAVADAGVGIRSSLSPRYPEINNDRLALKFAMMPHVSGTFGQAAYGSMANNAGLGLFFVKEIAVRASGGFFLGSGKILADVWGNANGSAGQKYTEGRNSGWPGTFAFLQLRRSNIADFAGLLSHCRDLAAKARKDPREFSLDFLDGIPDINGLVRVNVFEFEENVEKAAQVREELIIPAITGKELVVMDFSGIRFATQSFVHACLYKVLRDFPHARSYLSFANCSNATKEAIKAVAYADPMNS